MAQPQQFSEKQEYTVQQGYPVQQQAYPPQQGYPAQQQGYPVQQQGYPVQQQQGYPVQQQGYPVQQQPQAAAPMTVAGGGNRNVRNLPYDAQGQREWSNGLLGCFGDLKTCCLASWCPCLAHARNRRRLAHLERTGLPDPDRDGVSGPDGVLYTLLEVACDMGWILQIKTRGEIRRRYNIRGSDGGDCMAAFCCQACDLVQGSMEIELEENSFNPQHAHAVA